MHRLTALGALDLRDGQGRQVRDVLAQPKRVALLLFLTIEGRRGAVARERLLALFWPELDETHARNALSQALYHLRQALPDGAMPGDISGAVGADAMRLWADVTAFEDALAAGERELALDLYRGPLAPYLATDGMPDLEHWLDGRRAALHRQAIAAGTALAETSLAAGDTAAAARAAARTLALHPDDEYEVRGLLALMDAAGDRGGALAAYEARTRQLAALDLAPDPATAALAATIRAKSPPAPPLVLPSPNVPAPPGSEPEHAAAAGIATSPHRARRVAPWLVVTAVVAAGMMLALTRGLTGRSDRGAMSVAVLPFTVRGAPSHGYLREGLVDLLSVTLDGTAGVSAIDPRAVMATSALAPAAAAERLGVSRYIDGDVMVAGGRLRVRATLHERATGTAIASTTALGDTTALFAIVDSVAARLLAELAPGRDTALTRLAAVSTRSLPALRAFLDGERALRRGEDTRAGAAFFEAATLDTTFAMAQYRLALAATWAPAANTGDAGTWAASATANAARLTTLARELLAAYLAYRQGRIVEAERRYRMLTAARPDNVEAWFMLGETLMHFNPLRGRPVTEGWEPFVRVIALGGPNPHAQIHLARIAAAEARTAQLDSLVTDFQHRFGQAERSLELEALRAVTGAGHTPDPALLAQARAANDFVVNSLVASTVGYAQNPRAALAFAAIATDAHRNEWSRRGARRLAINVEIAAGTWDRSARWGGDRMTDAWRLQATALAASEPLFGVSPERLRALRGQLAAAREWPQLSGAAYVPDRSAPLGRAVHAYLDGLLAVRTGDTASAARQLAALRHTRADGADDLAAALQAAQARARGDLPAALAHLARFRLDALSDGVIPTLLVSHWGTAERFAKAEALAALGRYDEALALYASYHGGWDAGFASVATLRRAELLERAGDSAAASHYFTRAAGMLAEAEADFQPLLARARDGITRRRPRGDAAR
jgi:DNA-binding SARP family transcriptional activator/TolB-like protein